MFAGNFPPAGWLMCNGATLPISENEILYQLIGTTYGGDGQSTFAIPNLCGRAPVHMGTGPGLSPRTIGEQAGVEQVTLTVQQIPQHTHPMLGSADPAGNKGPAGGVLGRAPADAYASEFDPGTLNAQAVTPQGGSQPHENMQPYLVIGFIISLFGVFPSPT
jgi:microcystin-dependent protein